MTDSAAPATTGKGPRLLIASGVLLVVLAVVAAVVAASAFWRTLPTDVVTRDGRAGGAVLVEVPVPGEQEVRLEQGRYAVWLALPASSRGSTTGGAALEPGARATTEVEVRTADGEPVPVDPPSYSGTVGMGGTDARVAASFAVPADGTYVVSAVGPAEDGGRLLVTPDEGVLGLMSGIFGTIGGVFLALLLGAVGLGLLAGGLVWRYRRRHPPRTAGPGQVPPQHP